MYEHNIWTDIPGFPGYQASKLGHIRSPRKVLNPFPVGKGYLGVTLFANGERFDRRVHRLVLEAFVGPCPEGMEACHNNSDPADNRLENLRWDTKPSNTADRERLGRNVQARKTHCPADHEYTPENTLVSGGRRYCRACRRVQQMERYHAKGYEERRVRMGAERRNKRR